MSTETLALRRSADRGQADHGWLQSRHSFSFGSYQDPRYMGFGNLRVINEDRVAPGSGFGTHGHRDMEIVSVVLSGALAHRDSLGHGSSIRPGEVQCMSAGRGILHSEHNDDPQGTTHFLQIWFLPDAPGGEPSYSQRPFDPQQWRGRLSPVVSGDGRGGSLRIRADAVMSRGDFDGSESADVPLDPARLAYVHVVQGRLEVNDHVLHGGDALMIEHGHRLRLARGHDAQVLVFDLRRVDAA